MDSDSGSMFNVMSVWTRAENDRLQHVVGELTAATQRNAQFIRDRLSSPGNTQAQGTPRALSPSPGSDPSAGLGKHIAAMVLSLFATVLHSVLVSSLVQAAC